jgi:hypothetical protein
VTKLNTRSPECGWPPLVEWLSANGLDASDVREIDVDDHTLAGVVVIYKRRDGKRYIDGDEVATETRRVQFLTPPPRLEPLVLHEGGIIPKSA